MSQTRCKSVSEACPRARRWSARLGRWLWLCDCGRAFHDLDGAPAAMLRSDPDPRIACPVCGAGMAQVAGRHGVFLSCARWPSCKGTAPISTTTATAATDTEGETP